MASTKKENPTKSWKELNKIKKEEKKKWKEEKLLKKFKKMEKLKTEEEKSNQPKTLKEAELSTVSIALPGSILDNAQSAQLRAYLAGQIARAACVFQIDEVVIFDDMNDVAGGKKSEIEDADGLKTAKRCCVQLARILQYLECPQYLRKYFFPIHQDLQYAGLVNPLDAPSHLRQNDEFLFREGVVTNKPVKANNGSAVNIGLLQDVTIDKVITPGVRVTVKLQDHDPAQGKKQRGVVVSPKTPRIETGVYWGYSVRLAASLSEVFSKSPYKKGYDLTVGTSDKGSSIDEIKEVSYKHVLIVFGGLYGLEQALESDEHLNVDDPSLLFDHYINSLPHQGSRTIRTEEAILVTLAALRPKMSPKNPPKDFTSFKDYKVSFSSTEDNISQDLARFD